MTLEEFLRNECDSNIDKFWQKPIECLNLLDEDLTIDDINCFIFNAKEILSRNFEEEEKILKTYIGKYFKLTFKDDKIPSILYHIKDVNLLSKYCPNFICDLLSHCDNSSLHTNLDVDIKTFGLFESNLINDGELEEITKEQFDKVYNAYISFKESFKVLK